jgi:hypothetical protein
LAVCATTGPKSRSIAKCHPRARRDYDYTEACGTVTSADLQVPSGCQCLLHLFATAQDINGGESDVGTSGGYGGLITFNGEAAGAKPEKTENYELGTKWNLMDNKLLATAAMFHIVKSDVMEGADYASRRHLQYRQEPVSGVSNSVWPATSPAS